MHSITGFGVFIGNDIAHVEAGKGESTLRVSGTDGKTHLKIKIPNEIKFLASSHFKIALGSNDVKGGKIFIFDANRQKLINTVAFNKMHIKKVIYSPDGKYIACLLMNIKNEMEGKDPESKIIVFDPEKKESKFEMMTSKSIYSLEFSQNGRYITYIKRNEGFHGTFFIVNIRDPDVPIRRVKWSFHNLAILSPDNQTIILVTLHGSLRAIDFSGRVIFSYDDTYWFPRIALLPDKQRAIIIDCDHAMLIDTKRWIPQLKINIKPVPQDIISFSPDSRRMIISSIHNTSLVTLPSDHFSILEMKLDGIIFLPEYVSKLRRDKKINNKLKDYKMSGGIGDIITSYLK